MQNTIVWKFENFNELQLTQVLNKIKKNPIHPFVYITK